MKMIKITALVLAVMGLSGCSQNRLFANYRELDQTELIQTMGMDREENEVSVTVATGVTEEGAFSVFTGKSATVTMALSKIHTLPTKKYLFFGHTNNLLIGSGMLNDMTECLDYIQRSVDMRLDTPFFIVRETTAKELMRQAQVGDARVTELLKPLTDESNLGSDNHVFTAKEILSSLSARGYALVYAVKLTTDPDKLSDGTANIMPAGYGVMRGTRVIGYVEYEDCLGVNLIINRAVNGILPVGDDEVGHVSVSLANSKCDVRGNFSGNRLDSISLDIKISANIEQVQDGANISDPTVIEKLQTALAQSLGDYCRRVLQISRELKTDFLGLGKRINARDPKKFAAMGKEWDEMFPQTAVDINITALIQRTYDIMQTEGVTK